MLSWGVRNRREQLVVKKMDKSIQNTKGDNHTLVTQITSQRNRKKILWQLSCHAAGWWPIKEKGQMFTHAYDLPTEIGKREEKHSVCFWFTTDFFLIQSLSPECQASEIFGVKNNSGSECGIWTSPKRFREKNPRGSREYFHQSFGRKSVRDTKMWHCTKDKEVHKNFPERCHR